MTYTNGLDSSVPTQGEFIKNAASRIRALTAAIRERLLTVFEDPDADPLVYKATRRPARVVQVEYTFPDPNAIPAGFGSGLITVPLPATDVAPTPPANATVVLNWQVGSGGLLAVQLVVLPWIAYVSGTDVKFVVHNPSGVSVDLGGEKVSLSVIYPIA